MWDFYVREFCSDRGRKFIGVAVVLYRIAGTKRGWGRRKKNYSKLNNGKLRSRISLGQVMGTRVGVRLAVWPEARWSEVQFKRVLHYQCKLRILCRLLIECKLLIQSKLLIQCKLLIQWLTQVNLWRKDTIRLFMNNILHLLLRLHLLFHKMFMDGHTVFITKWISTIRMTKRSKTKTSITSMMTETNIITMVIHTINRKWNMQLTSQKEHMLLILQFLLLLPLR